MHVFNVAADAVYRQIGRIDASRFFFVDATNKGATIAGIDELVRSRGLMVCVRRVRQ